MIVFKDENNISFLAERSLVHGTSKEVVLLSGWHAIIVYTLSAISWITFPLFISTVYSHWSNGEDYFYAVLFYYLFILGFLSTLMPSMEVQDQISLDEIQVNKIKSFFVLIVSLHFYLLMPLLLYALYIFVDIEAILYFCITAMVYSLSLLWRDIYVILFSGTAKFPKFRGHNTLMSHFKD